MAETVQEFFQNLESRADSSKTAGMTNSYVFEIEGAGEWKVDVDDGKVTVTEGGGDGSFVAGGGGGLSFAAAAGGAVCCSFSAREAAAARATSTDARMNQRLGRICPPALA